MHSAHQATPTCRPDIRRLSMRAPRRAFATELPEWQSAGSVGRWRLPTTTDQRTQAAQVIRKGIRGRDGTTRVIRLPSCQNHNGRVGGFFFFKSYTKHSWGRPVFSLTGFSSEEPPRGSSSVFLLMYLCAAEGPRFILY